MRRADVLLALYSAVCLGALIWPGYAWLGGGIEPYVLGLPASLAWNVLWVSLTFFALLAYHRVTGGEDAGP